MSKFSGFTCDEDGTVIGAAQRHRQIIRIEGPSTTGQVERDLCPSCAEAVAEDMGPLGPIVHRRHLATTAPEPIHNSATGLSSTETG